jgi:mannose-6-phosphate isomerase
MPLAPILLGPNQPPRFYRGGRGIARLRGTAVTSDYSPEDLVGSTTELFGGGGLTVLDDGSTLRDAIVADPVSYLGPGHVARFGDDLALLVKLLDTGERLVVHFHPGREFAGNHLHSWHGKTEAWVVTDVVEDPADDSSGYVYLGFREAVGMDTVRGWVDAQDKKALLGSLNKVALRPGDTCLVPAGVPHAIGAGITVVEVQEPTDFSIMLEWEGFAIDGRAEGHLGLGFDLALQALDRSAWDRGRLDSLLASRPHGLGSGLGATEAGVRRLLPVEADDFFRVERVELGGSAGAMADFGPEVAVLVVLGGRGRLSCAGGDLPLSRGTTAFVPYGAGATRIEGRVSLLRCMPPDQAGMHS